MSLYEICRSVLAETGWTVFTSIATNTDQTAIQIKEICNTELESLANEYDWMHLRSTYTFNTVVGQRIYIMPDDFDHIDRHSVFNQDQYVSVRGSIPIEEWQFRRHGLLSDIINNKFRLMHNGDNYAIELAAEPSSVTTMVLEYYSNNLVMGDDDTPKRLFALDTDVSRVPEEIVKLGVKWRFRRVKGMDFTAELAEYNNHISKKFARKHAFSDIPIGRSRQHHPVLTHGYVPENGFG